MATEFSGRLNDRERAEAAGLIARTRAEKAVLVAIFGLGLAAGAVVPLWQRQPLSVLPLMLAAVSLAILAGTRIRRRELIRKAVGEHIEGVWNGEVLEVHRGTDLPIHLSLSQLNNCRVGQESMLVWSGSVPIVIAASLLAEPSEFPTLRALAGDSCQGAMRKRNLVLVASVIGWIVVLTVAWVAWG